MKKYKVTYSKDRVAEAKERRLAWRNGQKTDQIPFYYRLEDAPQKYTKGEWVSDSDKALEDWVITLNHQMSEFPDCDFIPYIPMDYLGQGVIPSMFGAKHYILEDNRPYTEGRIIQNLEDDLLKLSKRIDPDRDGWGPILRDCVQKFIDATDGEIPVGACDVQSPYGIATKLIGNEELMLAIYDYPELVHELMEIATNAIIDTIKAMEKWVGNPDLLIKNYIDPFPGGGIVLWDDYISVISPKLHKEFCLPYNLRIYKEFGRGHLHTCGPNFPNYLDEVISNRPVSIDAIILTDMSRTREDMLKFKHIADTNNIRVHARLTANNRHVLDPDDIIKPDVEFARQISEKGGLLWWEYGTKEEGLQYMNIVKKLKNGV